MALIFFSSLFSDRHHKSSHKHKKHKRSRSDSTSSRDSKDSRGSSRDSKGSRDKYRSSSSSVKDEYRRDSKDRKKTSSSSSSKRHRHDEDDRLDRHRKKQKRDHEKLDRQKSNCQNDDDDIDYGLFDEIDENDFEIESNADQIQEIDDTYNEVAELKKKFNEITTKSHVKNEKEKQKLIKTIDETILTTIDQQIQVAQKDQERKRDQFVIELFGTDNFDDWDDDEALSDIQGVQKIKEIREQVNVKNETIYDRLMCTAEKSHFDSKAKLLQPNDTEEEIDKKDIISKIISIEEQYQFTGIPQHVAEKIRMEKTAIANNVKKYIMPYYKANRIQPMDLFERVVRKISYIFYDRINPGTQLHLFF